MRHSRAKGRPSRGGCATQLVARTAWERGGLVYRDLPSVTAAQADPTSFSLYNDYGLERVPVRGMTPGGAVALRAAPLDADLKPNFRSTRFVGNRIDGTL